MDLIFTRGPRSMIANRAKSGFSSSSDYRIRPELRVLDPVDLDDDSNDDVDAATWTKPSDESYRRVASMGSGSSRRERPSNTPLYSGRELGSYRLLERLGRGAQGEVWKAVRIDCRPEPVAIKVLRPSLASNPARRAQFLHEAERGRRLTGESLLPVTESAEDEGHCYMVMPFVAGVTLRDVIHWRGEHRSGEDAILVHEMVTMNDHDYVAHALRCLIHSALALARVHDLAIVHRDVKPANILLDVRLGAGVYLCDFGLGRDLDVATLEQMRDGAGTPIYMAPERLLRKTADEVRCDIFSLGVTAYEALVLERPYRIPRGIDQSALSAYLVRTRPVRPSIVRRDFPAELEAIIMKAMARDPAARYGSARAVAADLERFADDWRRQERPPRVSTMVRRTRLDQPAKTRPCLDPANELPVTRPVALPRPHGPAPHLPVRWVKEPVDD